MKMSDTNVKFDYSKLLGKIKEKGYIQSDIAKKVGIGKTTFNEVLSGKTFLRQPTIIKICDVLEIAYKDIPLYFFTQRVQEN
jgi:transcriptional regulator with XRE-family HTH domain